MIASSPKKRKRGRPKGSYDHSDLTLALESIVLELDRKQYEWLKARPDRDRLDKGLKLAWVRTILRRRLTNDPDFAKLRIDEDMVIDKSRHHQRVFLLKYERRKAAKSGH